jgi:hypothetical protein
MQLKKVLLIISIVFSVSCQAADDWQQELRDANISSNYSRVRELSIAHSDAIFDGTDSQLKLIAAIALWEDKDYTKKAHAALEAIRDSMGDEDQAVIDGLLFPVEDDEG